LRIYARGPARGNPACAESHCDKEEWNQCEGEGIVALDSIQHTGEELAQCESRGNADAQSDDGEHHALAKDEPLHLGSLRTQRHTNADLALAPADRIAHNAVESDCGQHQANETEDTEETRCQVGQEESVANMLLD